MLLALGSRLAPPARRSPTGQPRLTLANGHPASLPCHVRIRIDPAQRTLIVMTRCIDGPACYGWHPAPPSADEHCPPGADGPTRPRGRSRPTRKGPGEPDCSAGTLSGEAGRNEPHNGVLRTAQIARSSCPGRPVNRASTVSTGSPHEAQSPGGACPRRGRTERRFPPGAMPVCPHAVLRSARLW